VAAAVVVVETVRVELLLVVVQVPLMEPRHIPSSHQQNFYQRLH
jgi:hypothetical protein